LYGKVFLSIYDGTLYGHWEAIITMQQLIALADADGIVDMTPQAIAARTSIPFDIIERGLKKLSEPDPYSRTPGEDGRRIILIDEHRPWGWQLVNYLKYKHLRDSDEVRAQTRERVRKHREKRNAGVTASNASNAEKRYTDIDTDTKKHTPPYSGAFLRFWGSWPKNERKASQGKCWAVWLKADFDLQAETILAHVDGLKSSDGWQRGFVPAPLTYLNQRRWEGAEAPQAEAPRVAL
jgi:hypothetical protein